MKRLILSSLISAFALFGFSETAPFAAEWSKLIDGKTTAGDQSIDIAIDAAGNACWLGTYGTKTSDKVITFGGETLFEGSDYEGTSCNHNFALIKTDTDGNKLWVVYSNSGDFGSNSGGCASTSDGGIVAVVKVRHTDGFQDKAINFVDATGADTEINWAETAGQPRVYKIAVLKISAAGKIEWTRLIDFDTTPGSKASGNYTKCYPDCFNLGTVATDKSDNIYMALNYKSALSIPCADDSKKTIPASNVENWNGNPQTAAGNFMVLSLDKDGYYRKSLVTEGASGVAYCQRVKVDNDRVYAQGYITGNGSSLSIDGKTLSPSEIMSPVLLAADTELNVLWAKCYPAEKVENKNALQNIGINPVGSTLWITGQFNLKFTDPDDNTKFIASTQGSTREGFILKLDAATGNWLASRVSREDKWNKPSEDVLTGLTGYFGVLQNEEHPEKIYVFGYVMKPAIGAFLREYDATTLVGNVETGQNNVITEGKTPSCQAIVYDGAHCAAYMTVRGNGAFKLSETETAAPSGWGVLATKVKLPENMKTSGIEDIVIDSADNDTEAEYYNLYGIRVTNPVAGQIYIRRCGNKTEKVIL